ncbi:hypothetical protein [Undibacterium danionis]|uniref:Sulfotransferase family protein n=1 Tax=Undibacterium danionis TaxID=1812100 RepID=A0ABV6IB59_9BURK
MPSPAKLTAEERSFIQGKWIEASTLLSLKNWYPVSICPQELEIYWRDMGQQRFYSSFFQNTLNEQAHDQRRVCKTSFSALTQFEQSLEPTAFVFHVSRCGSTLLTQALSTLESCVVLSEPPVIDAFLRAHKVTDETNLRRFQQLIAALGQQRFTNEKHLIIKLDSWHLGRLDFIRQAYPKTPMLFLYRDPQQVLDSHRRQRGPQMVPGLVDLGDLQISQENLSPGDLDGYCLKLLAQFYSAAITHLDDRLLHLINYQELPAAIWEDILERLNIECSEHEKQQMKTRSQFHSKHPHQFFQGDAAIKTRHAFLNDALALYQQLESSRITQRA